MAQKVVADIGDWAGGKETLRAPSVNDCSYQWLTNKFAHKSKGTSNRYGVAVTGFLPSLGIRAIIAADRGIVSDDKLELLCQRGAHILTF